eukprot:m.69968 g.69968  ORF g.69968 m.69968 type:complete len:468 (+) comp18452_c0_seq1:40-1443(+)
MPTMRSSWEVVLLLMALVLSEVRCEETEGSCNGAPGCTEKQRCVKIGDGTVVCGPVHTYQGDCVVNPEGVVVCGEAVPKQPVPYVPPAVKGGGSKSGYTHKQLEYASNSSTVPMEYRRLGGTGLRVSAFSYGSWITFSYQLGKGPATDLMRAAFTAGINFFDTAEAYADGEAERLMGEVISDGIADGFWEREDLVISTKVFWGKPINNVNDVGLSRKHVIEGVLESLDRLQLGYVDIVYAHRPDRHTPIEETVRAFDYLINNGKAMYWGTSEWSATDILQAQAVADKLGLVSPVVEQPEFSLLRRDRVEREYSVVFGSQRGYGATTYSALGLGILTGKYNDGIPENSRFTVSEYESLKKSALDGTRFGTWDKLIKKVKEFSKLADSLEASSAQLALAWCLKNPSVSSVILGATTVAQLHENVAALALLPKLTPSVLKRIDELMGNASPAAPIDHVARALQRANMRLV